MTERQALMLEYKLVDRKLGIATREIDAALIRAADLRSRLGEVNAAIQRTPPPPELEKAR